MPTDLTKTSGQLIVDLINAKNGTAFTTAQVAFEAPETMPYDAPKNTAVVVKGADETSPLQAPVTVYYDRVALGAVGAHKAFTALEDAGYLSTHDALDEINDALDTSFTAADLEDLPVTGTGYPKVMVIRAKAGHLTFLGQHSIDIVDLIA